MLFPVDGGDTAGLAIFGRLCHDEKDFTVLLKIKAPDSHLFFPSMTVFLPAFPSKAVISAASRIRRIPMMRFI